MLIIHGPGLLCPVFLPVAHHSLYYRPTTRVLLREEQDPQRGDWPVEGTLAFHVLNVNLVLVLCECPTFNAMVLAYLTLWSTDWPPTLGTGCCVRHLLQAVQAVWS